jgi:glycosyltransferase involved in cell wall biosynthesis
VVTHAPRGTGPVVSIIIPAYNARPYIANAIESVRRQTFPDWELIIVDDGSGDGIADVVEPFLADERIRYFWKPHSGVSAARNDGVRRARGAFIAFLDADDSWEPLNLERKLETLAEHADVDWVYSDAFLADAEMRKRAEPGFGLEGDILQKILLWDGSVIPGPASNLLLRRKCFDDGLAWDTNLSSGADQELTIQLARRYSSRRVPAPLWTYRDLPGSMSKNAALTERDHLLIYEKAQREGLFATPGFESRCVANLYLTVAGAWWVNDKNKKRGSLFFLRAILAHPPVVGRVLKKAVQRLHRRLLRTSRSRRWVCGAQGPGRLSGSSPRE